MQTTTIHLKPLQRKKQMEPLDISEPIAADWSDDETVFIITFCCEDGEYRDIALDFFKGKPSAYISDGYSHGNAKEGFYTMK
nr:hypothetical protein [uncultured Mediterraneibacter sp.]